MAIKNASIVELSVDEVNNISGGWELSLPTVSLNLPTVLAIGTVTAGLAATAFPGGAAITLGVFACYAIPAYFIKGDSFDKATRTGVSAEITTFALAYFGFRFMQQATGKKVA